MKQTKRRLCCLFLALLLFGSSPLLFSSCAPKVEDLYDRVVWLLTESQSVNEVIWGEGLAVWEKDSEFAKEEHLYDNDNYLYYKLTDKDYLFVSDQAAFHSIEEIKAEAERYYTEDYLKASVYPQTFDGVLLDTMGSRILLKPRFYEEGNKLFQYENAENYYSTGKWVYDFSTMKVVRRISNRQTCYVSLLATLDTTGESQTVRIKLQVQNNQWFLAGPVG